MNPIDSCLFVSNVTLSIGLIHQLTITGDYIRSIEFNRYPFIRASSLTYDVASQHILIVDSSNSIICSLDDRSDGEQMQILVEHADQLHYPQDMCLTNEGHMAVVECSVTGKHALNLYRYRSCACHTRTTTVSMKTSENTSNRSMSFFSTRIH
jgi:hypothetical protein